MVVNPFQAGQLFNVTRAQQEQQLVRSQRREQGINALAEMFGPTALAPAERASVFGTERAGRTAASAEEQRGLENQRQAIIDTRVAEAADLKRRQGVSLNLVNFLDIGMKQNVPFEILAEKAIPAMQAIGIPEEEISQTLQAISQDPVGALPRIKAALLAGQKKPAGQFGRIVAGRVDGKDVFGRDTPSGFEIIKDFTPVTPEIQRARLGLTEEKLALGGSKEQRQQLKAIFDEGKVLEQRRVFAESTVAAAGTVTRDIDDLIDLLPLGTLTSKALRAERGKDNPAAAAARVTQSLILGTDEFNQKKLIDSVKSNIAIDSLLRIKKSGAGLGQVPQSQLILLQSLLGNLDLSRDPALFLQNVRDVQDRYNEVIRLMGTRDKDLEKREKKLRARRSKIEGQLFGDDPSNKGGQKVLVFNPATGRVE